MENNTFKETTIIDYIPILQEYFPYLSKKDIKNIIQYGWKLIYSSNCYGCDTLVTSQKYKFWFYIGGLCNDSIRHFTYYKKRLMRKLSSSILEINQNGMDIIMQDFQKKKHLIF